MFDWFINDTNSILDTVFCPRKRIVGVHDVPNLPLLPPPLICYRYVGRLCIHLSWLRLVAMAGIKSGIILNTSDIIVSRSNSYKNKNIKDLTVEQLSVT
jgi:hypothetical protein